MILVRVAVVKNTKSAVAQINSNKIKKEGSDSVIDLYEQNEKLKYFMKTIQEVGVSL